MRNCLNIRRCTILVLFSIVESIAFCQESIKPDDLIGKWVLKKHVVTAEGRSKSYLIKTNPTTYSFFKNGTFSCSYFSESREHRVEGNWKLVLTDRTIKISLFDVKEVPDDPINVITDYDLPILKFTNREFSTEEFLFTEEMPGISFFTKTK